MASLIAWMNGERVGTWATSRSGVPVFAYAKEWAQSPRARALSLSLPITANLEVRGPVVDYYFDNLLPDNPGIRRRLRDRYHLRSSDTFHLLEAVGRDCAGAIQLLPPGAEPTGFNRIESRQLDEAEVEQHLREVLLPTGRVRGHAAAAGLRLSLAGAQEKTALLRMGNAWHMPLGATPTTHILKLPLGIIGNFRGDFSDSTENEWLCAQLLHELGLPVARTEMARFGDQKVLVVERFDRRWIGTDATATTAGGFTPVDGMWIARLPQEDFCQATGRSPTRKYESDGGPTIREITALLSASSNATTDKTHFLLAQLAFWLLAATDGHGKNFSIHLQAGGSYAMTPLYDVLSAWPVIGNGANRLPLHDVRLAMAVHGKSPHYKLREIQVRHWRDLAQRVGGDALWQGMVAMIERLPGALERVANRLPAGFPGALFSAISEGTRAQSQRFLMGSTGIFVNHDR